MGPEGSEQETGYLGLRGDWGSKTGDVGIWGWISMGVGLEGLRGLYVELEFKAEASANLDLDIWCEGVTGVAGRTFGLI